MPVTPNKLNVKHSIGRNGRVLKTRVSLTPAGVNRFAR